MKSVTVIFADCKYNYSTSVNGKCSDAELRKYFVGTSFDMGPYPTENFQKCIDIKIK